MGMTFDATLKDMGRESPQGFLTIFDQAPTLPTRLLNVDLSTVTTAADLLIGLGDPLVEVVHIDFQSSAAAWKHADILAYNALAFAQYRVPVHSLVVLLRPEAAHSNMNGRICYAPRPGRGSMDFSYEVIPLWKRPAAELLTSDLGVVPLAMLGQLPPGMTLEAGLASVAQQLAQRLEKEADPARLKKLLTDAYLLTGLRVRRPVADQVFRGVRAMQESDTYLAIVDEGREKQAKKDLLLLGTQRFGPADEAVRAKLNAITDLERLDRQVERLLKASSWQDLLDTP
ncbi:MAG: hypothetical protein L0Z62_21520 [Gemmataceae bacterium]|nr:hypothetical protein [Gemmataceae bacterium]